MQLSLNCVSHYYGTRPALTNLSFSLAEGEVGVLIGPSGAGKSTVLNCIAGLERVAAGEIKIGDKLVSSTDTHVPPERRELGLVFQESALFPHLDVKGNIAFGLAGPQAKKNDRVRELLEICRLDDLGDARPHELSGGQQQRVALARALAPRPRLLLLDEPFSNSDAVLRTSLLNEVRSILKQQGSTALMVTHDQYEAFAIADRCGVIDTGTICQWDTPYNLYHRPVCLFAANFIGEGVMLDGQLVADDKVETELGVIQSDTPLATPMLGAGKAVKMLLRPDDIVLSANGGVESQVVARSFRGADIFYTLVTKQGTKLSAVLPSRHDFELGEQVKVSASVDHVVVFPSIA